MTHLPTGWAVAPLEAFVISSTGGVWGEPASTAHADSIPVRVVRGAEFRNWSADRATTAPVRIIPRRALLGRELSAGDIVLEVSGGGPTQPVGRAILIDTQAITRADLRLVCSNFCRRLEMAKPIDAKYVWYQLQDLYSRGWTDQFQRATTNIRNLQVGAYLANTQLVIAPSAEQKRIVAALDEQFSRIDAGVEALERPRYKLERMREAALLAAVRVPEGTKWVPAAKLFKWASGKRISHSKNAPGKFPVFGGNGITGRSNQCLATDKTIVIGRVGAQCGNVYLTDGPAWITDNAIYSGSHDPEISLPFAQLVFQRAHLRDRAAGTGQPFVTQTILNEVMIPLASSDWQASAVQGYLRTEDAVLSVLTQIKALQLRQNRLRSSILAAAFAGTLVSQEAGDEPAALVLQRIAMQNDHQTKTRKARRARDIA